MCEDINHGNMPEMKVELVKKLCVSCQQCPEAHRREAGRYFSPGSVLFSCGERELQCAANTILVTAFTNE